MARPSKDDHKNPVVELILRCENAEAIDPELIRKAKVQQSRDAVRLNAKTVLEGKRLTPGRPPVDDPRVRAETYPKRSTVALWKKAAEEMGYPNLSKFIEAAVNAYYAQYLNRKTRESKSRGI